MKLELSAEEKQIKDMISEFADEEIMPEAEEIDKTDEVPTDLIEELGELGILGIPFEEDYGGIGMSYHPYVMAVEEVSRASGGLGTIVSAHISLAGGFLDMHADDEQKDEYLTPLALGEDIGAFAFTEADAGSDLPSMETTAEKEGDEYVINGSKMWISNGAIADTAIVAAKTDPEAGAKGITAFIVRPEEDDGFIVEGTEDKIGDKGCPTAELRFDNMRIPESRMIGEQEGYGLIQGLQVLNAGRIGIAARSVGIAQAALDEATEYAQQREQFGQPIGQFQAIQHKLADMQMKVDAARWLTHYAADKKRRGDDYRMEAAEAKAFASEVSTFCADENIQIHGGFGYSKEYRAEQLWRDARINRIYEGTNEVIRNTIGEAVQE